MAQLREAGGFRSHILRALPTVLIVAGFSQAGPILPTIGGNSPLAIELRKAFVSLQNGKLDEAHYGFENVIQKGYKGIEPLIGMAEVSLEQKKPAEAESWLKRAMLLDGNSPLVYRSWANYLVAVKRFSEADAAFRKASALAPKFPEALVDLGDMDLALGKPDNAAQAYRDALARQPDSAEAHLGLGSALSAGNHFAEAIPELRQAAKLLPSKPQPWFFLGLAYRASGDGEQAINAFSAALKIDGKFTQAIIARGDAFQAKGDSARAMADYSEALKFDPNNGLVQFRIGLVHLAANRIPQAEAAFHTAVQKDPNLADAWNDLAWLSAEKKTDLDMALTWAKKAVSIAPGEPRFTDTLAWVYRARKELNLAAQTLETFPARNQSPVLLYHLGLIELERGRKTEAAAALKQSLAGGSFAEAGDARKLLASLKP